MGGSIYYFTGTGNSLAIARNLAARLGANLVAIKAALRDDDSEISAECIGLVFPVYNHRIPYIVKRFVESLHISGDPYVFAVCTYGDSPCIALEYLMELLQSRELRLMGGFGVKMPYNYIRPQGGLTGLIKPFTLKETTDEEQRGLMMQAEQKIDRISKYVQSRQDGLVEAEHQRMEHAVDALNLREMLQKKVWLKIGGFHGKTKLKYLESIQLMDHAFFPDARCVRCGTCAKICPVGNIHMTKDGPSWKHHCEQCFACLQWCPRSALQFGKGTAGQNRYHHPDISLFDMLKDGSNEEN